MIVTLLALVIALLILTAGFVLFRTPTRSLLKLDKRTGYWIYKNHLLLTGNEEEAIRKAGEFYKFFAKSIIAFSIVFMIVVIYSAVVS